MAHFAEQLLQIMVVLVRSQDGGNGRLELLQIHASWHALLDLCGEVAGRLEDHVGRPVVLEFLHQLLQVVKFDLLLQAMAASVLGKTTK